MNKHPNGGKQAGAVFQRRYNAFPPLSPCALLFSWGRRKRNMICGLSDNPLIDNLLLDISFLMPNSSIAFTLFSGKRAGEKRKVREKRWRSER